MRWLLAALLFGAACAADDAPPADIDGGLAVDAAIDATAGSDAAAACATRQECPCFSNHDCPATHTCKSFDDTGESVFCVVGERGEGVAGDRCTGEASCASALCIEDDSGSFCSDLCEDASTCPAVLPTCLYIGFGVDESICAP